MTTRNRPFHPIVIALVVLLSGATAGALFGERSVPEEETQLMVRASRVVNLLVEWLPTENDAADIVYDGIGGMLEVLDPHSNFLDPRTFHKMRARQEGSFFGVGIIISRRDGKITVIAPMAGTPAAAKGLRTGDIITAVGEESTEGMNLDDVVDLVRGPEGTDVHLTIARPGIKDTFGVDITRTRIPQTTVRYAFMVRPDVGYIRLSEFTSSSAREVREAIERLQAEGMTKLLLDLRNNPGGSLDAAIGVVDPFLSKGDLIVTTKGRTRSSHTTLAAPGKSETFEGVVIALVNEGSASASEIVAGALQDHDRGLVIGETTWGKGLVQTVFTVRDAGLALTTARYYTPSGRSIQRDYDSFIDYITHRNGNGDGDTTETVSRIRCTQQTRAVRFSAAAASRPTSRSPTGPSLRTWLASTATRRSSVSVSIFSRTFRRRSRPRWPRISRSTMKCSSDSSAGSRNRRFCRQRTWPH